MTSHRAACAVLALSLVVACQKPVPPRVTPKSVTVTSISTAGVELDTKLAVENPNGFDLSAQAVIAKLVLDHSVDVGSVVVDKPFSLPAKSTTELDVPVSISWKSLPALVPVAQKPAVPYTVEGTVRVGGRLSVDVPFTIEGTLTREQLAKIVAVRLPF
jgi:LEA14-like dessication related protein